MTTKKAPAKRHDCSGDTRCIKIVAKENPHREGTARHSAFEAVRASKTVSDYAATGNKTKYIAAWRMNGHIAIVRPPEKPKPS